MKFKTKIYRAPFVFVKAIDNDVITASTVSGQGNTWNDNENPWESGIMEEGE